ncbi:MAG TPA: hypothetical protein VNG32_00445 [Candidatus Dormibacteraeota bacterium]|nr:hypothetical protein [Candidatus Dormibacteraeota bacterium]
MKPERKMMAQKLKSIGFNEPDYEIIVKLRDKLSKKLSVPNLSLATAATIAAREKLEARK